MISTELDENQQKMLEQLQQANPGFKDVFVTTPSCWQLQEEKGEYTLFVDHAWGRNALFDGTNLIEIWTFYNAIKSFPKLGFVIVQDNESQFNSWFFVPANDL